MDRTACFTRRLALRGAARQRRRHDLQLSARSSCRPAPGPWIRKQPLFRRPGRRLDLASLSSYGSRLYEYAHGGRRITTLIDSLGEGSACAVDPTTGDLAVANEIGGDYRSNVAIYSDASGVPAQYSLPDVDWPFSATYDDMGDLFVGGQVSVYDAGTDWLPKGATNSNGLKQGPTRAPTLARSGVINNSPRLRVLT